MNVVALESAHWPNSSVKEQVLAVVNEASIAAAKELQFNFETVNIIVQPNSYGCIPETGCGGRTFDSEFIRIVFDPTLPHGLEALFANLRATVFHECNHATRYASIAFDASFMNHVITEGLATVFERDFSKTTSPLWGKYENDETMQAWLEEVQSITFTVDKFDEYTYNHPDGRRWIAYKLGAWLVDGALKNSGKSMQELTTMPYDELLLLVRQ